MDIGRAFGAPFKDQNWVTKTLLGGLWFFLFVTSPAVTGAQIVYIRKVASGDETLPEWNDFGDMWVKGFLVSLAGLIYMLPVVVIMMLSVLPLMLAFATGDEGAAFAGLGGMCFLYFLAAAWAIGASIFLLAAIVNYAMNGTFGSMFAFGDIMTRIKAGGFWGAWGFSLLISLGLSIVVSALTSIVIGYILVPFIYYLAYMMIGHVFGQWAARVYRLPGIPAVATPSGSMPQAAPTPSPSRPAATPPPAPAPPVQPPAAPPQAPPAAPPAPPQEPPATTPPPAPPVPPEGGDQD